MAYRLFSLIHANAPDVNQDISMLYLNSIKNESKHFMEQEIEGLSFREFNGLSSEEARFTNAYFDKQNVLQIEKYDDVDLDL